jgi:hypothetical protein
MEYQLKEVVSKADKTAFLQLPLRIYSNDPQWIRPLDKDIEAVFDEEKNKFFKQGVCKRWLLYDAQHRLCGRIAAFINKKYKQEQPTGGIGFFECIDSQALQISCLTTAATGYSNRVWRLWMVQLILANGTVGGVYWWKASANLSIA